MNKFAHTLILLVFGCSCLVLWGILKLAPMAAHGGSLPGFTQLCIEFKPMMAVLPMLAAGYCVWVWFRKSEKLPSWVSFFATTMSVLVLITLPVLVAAYLPLLSAINGLPRQ